MVEFSVEVVAVEVVDAEVIAVEVVAVEVITVEVFAIEVTVKVNQSVNLARLTGSVIYLL